MHFIDYFNTELFNILNTPTEKWRKIGVKENLYQRGHGLKIVFEKLTELQKSFYTIVETGCAREQRSVRDQSTQIFEDFLNYYDGHLTSVDINEENCKIARQMIGSKVNIVCDDSVAFLQKGDWSQVDLFYLDSYDVKWRKPESSAQHHLNEFKAIEKFIKKDTIVAIDDNTWLSDTGERTGKGMLIYEYLSTKGIIPVYDGYTMVYIFENPIN